jgi:hypothetical protein
MTTSIDARKYVGSGFPSDEGARLARGLLDLPQAWWDSDSEIDLRELPSALLISSFFNGALQAIHDARPAALARARKFKWRVKYDFQRENIEQWMKSFTPVTPKPSAHA